MDETELQKLTRELLYVAEQMRAANKILDIHDKLLFGDKEKPDDFPGMVSEWREARHAAEKAERTTAGNRKLHYLILLAVAPPFIEFLFHLIKFGKP